LQIEVAIISTEKAPRQTQLRYQKTGSPEEFVTKVRTSSPKRAYIVMIPMVI